MERKMAVTIGGAMLALALICQAWAGADQAMDPAACQSRLIDRMAASCKFKSRMRHSDIPVIRNAAIRSCLKNTFIGNHKDQLMAEMAAADIGTRDYKIRYYLNNRFLAYASERGLNLNASEPMAALPHAPPADLAQMDLAAFCRYFSLPENVVAQKIEETARIVPEGTIGQMARAKRLRPEEFYQIIH